jgi:molecular chaperone GrpE (heat shock protein)
MKHLKLIESDLYDIRLATVRVIEDAANIQRLLAHDWNSMTDYQIKNIERLFDRVDELKHMLNHIKNRDVRKDISTCFDEEAA